jgi:CubicO group peptidase (beta-lactamase class C family)
MIKGSRAQRTKTGSRFPAFPMAAAALLAGAGCTDSRPVEDSPPPGQYQAAAIFSRQHGGQALLVMKGDEIVYEDNQNGGSVDRPYQLFSGTKSFNCALALSAVQDGLLSSLDEPVSTTLTEWQGDSRKSQITVRQVLNLSSGLAQHLLNLYAFFTDSYAFTSGIGTMADPGAMFMYGEDSFAVFEEVMYRKLKASAAYSSLDPLTYMRQRIFTPIGLKYGTWFRTLQGRPVLSFGAVISAREWIKYGKFLRDRGNWDGNQVLPGAGIDECTTGSAAMSAYGLGLWLNAAMPASFKGIALAQFVSPSFTGGGPTGLLYPGGPTDLFAAVGVTDHRMYMFRTEDLVVVRIGHGGILSAWSDAKFLKVFFGE